MIPQRVFIQLMKNKGYEPIVEKRYMTMMLLSPKPLQHRTILSFKEKSSFECDCESANADKILEMWAKNHNKGGK